MGLQHNALRDLLAHAAQSASESTFNTNGYCTTESGGLK